MQKKNKITFEHDGKEYSVLRPTAEHIKKGKLAYNKAFKEAIDSDAFLRAALSDMLREQGLWNDAKQKQHEQLLDEIRDLTYRLSKGGIKLHEAREIALQISDKRTEMNLLLVKHLEYDKRTAEAQAEDHQFNYLLVLCFVDAEKKQVYKDVDDYLNHGDDPKAIKAAESFAELLYEFNADFRNDLPENQFLIQYGFMDKNFRLVDRKEGYFISRDGKRIDENGRFVDENGNFIDSEGRKVDADGKWMVDSLPFLEDDGTEVVLEEDKKEEVVEEPVEQAG